MSGTDSLYYDYPEDYVDWIESGNVIKNNGGNLRNRSYYFKRGASFRGFGDHIVGRLHQDNMIFGHTSHFVCSSTHNAEMILAHLNSTIHRFIANGLNPGVHFEVGDGERLPIKREFENRTLIEELVSLAIEQRREVSLLVETGSDFDGMRFASIAKDGPLSISKFEDNVEAIVIAIHGILDGMLFNEYNISEDSQDRMYSDLPKNVARYPVIRSHSIEHPETVKEHLHYQPEDSASLGEVVEELSKPNELDLRELAVETKISPLTIAELRSRFDLYTEDERESSKSNIIFHSWDTIPKMGY